VGCLGAFLWVVLRFSWFFGCCLVSFAGSLLVGSLFSRFCLGGCLLGFCSGFSGALRFLFNKNLLIKKKKKHWLRVEEIFHTNFYIKMLPTLPHSH
jgi:hypothetical protein